MTGEPITSLGRAHLRWALTDGIGPSLFTRLVAHFGDASTALSATATQLASLPGLGPRRAAEAARSRDTVDIEPEIDAAAAAGVRIVCRADPGYPPGLRQIPNAPIVLYIKGDYRDTDAIALAIVGSRRCTIYGSEQARRFGELAAAVGLTVVSGLARGVDSFAHHGAVDAGGRSVAVLGSGLAEIYPPENAALAEKLLEHGAWISELPMHASIQRGNFPTRNRILAGLSLGVLVVEAAQRSGALITAHLANEYNREVFAIPGRLQEPMAEGTNGLIREGAAKLVASLDDILDGLGQVGEALRKGTPRANQRALWEAPATEADAHPSGTLTSAEQRVLCGIAGEPVVQDGLIQALGMPAEEVLAALTMLELKGLVRRLPGNLVARRCAARARA